MKNQAAAVFLHLGLYCDRLAVTQRATKRHEKVGVCHRSARQTPTTVKNCISKE
ncbi:hypothetical protein [Microcoleus sp. herbarium12]|uniref:hypothetical protein n=1 Tax=Microcoleus sp. herbarium12 TaxID=3055437 RepID=UPI002FD74E53